MRRISAIALVALVSASAVSAQARILTPHQKLAREIYKQLVEINTADSVGSVTPAARAMASRFRSAGFPARDVQVLIPAGKPTKGNLVVRYHGRAGSSLKPILLLAHLDVVAALRSDWPRDPFTLYEENGFFLGRGSSDDKAMAAIFVANLLKMKKEHFVPNRDIILALTADEEGGDANGVEWLVKDHRSLIDAAYALNEGGGGTLVNGKPISHSIQAAEKVSINLTLTATNPGGHSSSPRPDNAIYSLAAALTRIANNPFPVELNETTKGFFEEESKVQPDAKLAAAMHAIVADPSNAEAAEIISRNPSLNSTLRTTCVATRLSGGHAYNALPQIATANINCRMVPTSSTEQTIAHLKAAIADTSIKITRTLSGRDYFGIGPSTIDPQLMAAVTRITKRMFGDIPVIPKMSTGATDGKYLRAAGIPTFGVNGIFSASGEGNAHGRDEKLRVSSFFQGLEFLDRLVRELSSGS